MPWMPWIKLALFGAAILLLVTRPLYMGERALPKSVSYSELLEQVRTGRVAKMEIDEHELLATLKGEDEPKQSLVATRVPGLSPEPLVELLAAHDVELLGESEQSSWFGSLFWSWIVPIVHKVTIIPRSIGALGATLQLPTEDRYLMTREALLDRLCVMLGGRAAEELCFGSSSTGAQDDLERSTETARQMVCRYGMSAKLGPLTYGKAQGLRFLESAMGTSELRNFSEATAQSIDQEVRAIIEAEFARARAVLIDRRAQLERLAERLLIVETLEHAELVQLTGDEHPTPSLAALQRASA